MTLENVYYEPHFVEEAVFLALRGRTGSVSFHRRRERLYEIQDPDERDRAFQSFYRSMFVRLNLADPIYRALQEQPIILEETKECVIARAPTKKQQEAELLVSPEKKGKEKDRRSVRILLKPELLLTPESTLLFMRHELFHIADMLDSTFRYEPMLPPAQGGPSHDRLLRERYRVLWDTTIDGRMYRRGWAQKPIRNQRLIEFAHAFPILQEDTEREFRRFFEQDKHTHPELIAFALHPKVPSEGFLNSCREGFCSLCGFPTYVFEPRPESLPKEVMDEIHRDFPSWHPSQGLCTQCSDLYRARADNLACGHLSGREIEDEVI